MAATKELLTVLRLDDVDFKSGLSKSQKSLLGFSASVGAVGVAMIAAAKTTADYEVETLRAARSAGQSVETFSAMRHVADVAGVSIEDLSKATRKLITPTADAEEKLKSFGLSFRDASGRMKTQSSLLDEISAKYKTLPSNADRAALAMAAFGEDGAKITSVLAQNISDLTKEAEDMGLVVSRQAAESAEVFNKKVGVLSGSLEGLKNRIGESIISFINQTGILDKLSKAVQSVTGWWSGLSDSTKSMVIYSTAAAVAIGVVITALLGIVAAAPAVTAAVTAMTGGLNLIVLAAVAAATAVVGAITYIGIHFKKFEGFFTPIVSAMSSLKKDVQPVIDVFSKFGDALSGLKFLSNLRGSLGEIDAFATGIKVALLPATTAILILVAAVRSIILAWRTAITVGYDFAKILFNMHPAVMAVKGKKAFEDMEEAALDAKNTLVGAFESESGIIKQAASGIGKSWSEAIVKEVKEGKKEIQNETENPFRGSGPGSGKGAGRGGEMFAGVSNEIYDVSKSVYGLMDAFSNVGKAGADSAEEMAKGFEHAKNAVQSLGNSYTAFLKSQADLENVNLTNFKQKLDFQGGAIKAFFDNELAGFNAMIDAELATIESQKAEIEKAELAHQQRMKEIRDQYAKDRKAELDADLQAEFNRMQREFDERVKAIDSTNMTEMEKQAAAGQALADLQDEKNQLVAQSNERLSRDIEQRKREDDIADEARTQAKKDREEDLARRAKELEDQKAKAAEANSKRQEDLERARRLLEWNAGKQAFEAAKKAQVAQAVIGMTLGMLSTAQAASMIVSQLGIPGIPIAAAFAGTAGALILASGINAIQTANAAQYPPPPVFAAGGIATGASIFGEAGPMGSIGGFRGRELAIPLNRPGGDFEALKSEVASELVSGVKAGMMVSIQSMLIQNIFGPRDDERDVADRMNEEFYERVLATA